MEDLTGKVCLVTGADEGVGFGIVRVFLARHAKVAAGLLRRGDSLHKVAPALPVQMDVRQTNEVEEAVRDTVSEFGRIDVLINNAGVYPRCNATKLSFEDYAAVRDINLDGAVRASLAVVPHMRRQGGGVIINVGSITLRRGAPDLAHYLASKGGLLGFTRGMARDLGPYGVRCNMVQLGAVRTEGEQRSFPDPQKISAEVEARQALPGRMTPESVARVFAFLASEASGDITGQCLTVDRGWTHD